ncbi:tetratricopeptide repeat protein [Amorphus coralli]|uniref:tetratricopeptide repeat protein n=1 Tax=Amorphus coralli TaxID=340680 RepID=UPI0003819197|nr:tetratricopeptide repeat protein [Amorphus coralli]
MRATDMFALPITVEAEEAASAWAATTRAFLAHGAEAPEHLARTLEASPGFAMGHAARGLFCLLLAKREMTGPAREALGKARAAIAETGATPREVAYADALADWLDGHPAAAADRLDAVLARHLEDALTLKLVHQIRFMLGDATGMRRSVEGALDAYGNDHPAAGYVHGCQSFALEETGCFAAAEFAGRRALDLAPDDAWGLHAVAHVHDMTGRSRAGVAWLDGRDDAFGHCNNFRYHVWWHKALFHLDLGEIDAVLALYDQAIRAEKTDDFRDIANGASLLSRLELEGVDVGSRWEELAALCEGRIDDGCLVFADLHYLLALCGGNRDESAARLVARMRSDAETPRGDMGRITANPGVAAATALAAFRAGDYRAAHRAFQSARPRMQTIGGSHAQRDVFDRLAIEAAIRAGLFCEARALVRDRIAFRGATDAFAAARLKRIEAAVASGRESPLMQAVL